MRNNSETTLQPPAESNSAPCPIRIGDLLLDRGLITQEQIGEALAYQKDKGHKKLLGEVLIELEFVTEEQVMESLADAYDVPFAHISPRVADPKIIEVLPREFIESNHVLPLFLVHKKLTIALHEPTNVFLIEEVARLTGFSVQIVVATLKDIRSTLEVHLPQTNVFVIDDLVDDQTPDDLLLVDTQMADLSSSEAQAGDSPVIKLVNYVIYSAVEEGASDIHIEPGDQTLRVRFRVDGTLYEKIRPPYQMIPAVSSRIKIMSGLDISERRIPQDGAIIVMINKRPVDLRVSTMPGKYGEKVVMRVIDNSQAQVSLESSGFSFEMLEKFRESVAQPNGVVLVTGPTGSGKTTTLYGMINEVVDDTINLCTVENPVEYNLAGINQFQVNEKAGFTFASALRSLLRQDPDIIMVGEIRDEETARISIQAALTGHMVFSTLHTNDAISAVTRLVDIGIEPYLVAATIRGVLAQRLFKKICQNCKEVTEIPSAQQRAIDRLLEGAAPLDKVYAGRGCKKCRGIGYSGRLGVFELFIPDEELLDLISRGATLHEIRASAKQSGYYKTLSHDGIEKVRTGITTVDELLRNAAMT